MAFSEAEKASIRKYLGWTARYHQTDSRLEQAMYGVGDLADTVTLVQGLLTKLDGIETSIAACYGRLKAAKVGAIELPGMGELAALRSEGARFSGQLAATLGVGVRHNVWAAYGPSEFAGPAGISNAGNYWPHG